MRTKEELLKMTQEEIMDEAILWAESKFQLEKNVKDLLAKQKN